MQFLSAICLSDTTLKMLTGLFPHLSKFTAAQNSALLNVFDLCGDDTFRIGGDSVLFSFGEPSTDLIDQLVRAV